MRKLFLLFLLFCFFGCSGAKIKTQTLTIENDKVIKDVTTEMTPQISYQHTMRIVLEMIEEVQKLPLFKQTFKVVKVHGHTFVLPETETRQPIDFAAIVKFIRYTPTGSEVAKKAFVEGLQNLGIPLAIAGITTAAVQASRTSEELKPSTIAGGDVVQAEKTGVATSDRSAPMTDVGNTKDSHNTPTEIIDSHNTTTEIVGAE